MTCPPSSVVRLLEIRIKSGYCNLTQVKCYVLAENETLPSLLSIYIYIGHVPVMPEETTWSMFKNKRKSRGI